MSTSNSPPLVPDIVPDQKDDRGLIGAPQPVTAVGDRFGNLRIVEVACFSLGELFVQFLFAASHHEGVPVVIRGEHLVQRDKPRLGQIPDKGALTEDVVVAAGKIVSRKS